MKALEQMETVVVGAGILGAALAFQLRGKGQTVVVLERARQTATGISSRNSGVIHAAINHPPNSMKTLLCHRGNQLLRAFLASRDIPWSPCGKLVVAQNEQEERVLRELARQAPEAELRETADRPHGLRARRALFTPRTAVVDPVALTRRLLEESEALVLTGQEVSDLSPCDGGVSFHIGADRFHARRLVNCAGLGAPRLAKSPPYALARGSYFRIQSPLLDGQGPLVYPAKAAGSPFLGIHLTRTPGGEWLLGPDLEYVNHEDYRVDPAAAPRFLQEAQRYLPWLVLQDLQPAHAGIRPRLRADGWSDFQILGQGDQRQLVHLLGFESPGLTSALAAAERVAEIWSS
jgi:L-2-hydroxyglutarate oxidase LhgO